MSTRTRLGALGGTVCLAVVVLLIVPFLMAQGGETPAPAKALEIDGISLDAAEQDGGIVLTEPQTDVPSISANDARVIAEQLGGKSTRLVLAHLKDTNAEPDIDRLVWVAVMDPGLVPVASESDYVNLVMNFVDAKNGEFIYGYEEYASCTQTPETMAECEKRGIKPRPLETPVFLPGY